MSNQVHNKGQRTHTHNSIIEYTVKPDKHVLEEKLHSAKNIKNSHIEMKINVG